MSLSEKEKQYILDNLHKTNLQIAKDLNVTKGTIGGYLTRMGIKRPPKTYALELISKDEIFKDIPCLNSKYKISNYGRVINKDNMVMKDFDSNGYRRITLSPNGKKEKFFIHRLVAEAFIPKIKGKEFVNHIDLDKTNNHYSNLEWITTSENEIHKLENCPQVKSSLSKVNSTKDSKTKKEVYEEVNNICKDLKENKLSIVEIAIKNNVEAKRVSAIKNKRLWKSISDKYF